MAKPSLLNRINAAFAGEVSAEVLEAYRRASLAVYEALDSSELSRATGRQAGQNAWELPTAVKAELLCAWNAFVLQTLGDRLLEADFAADPATRGFVPPVTKDQILLFYQQVEGWLSRARQAHYNPEYRLDLYVPAQLPRWSNVIPCSEKYLDGLVTAMGAVRDHTEAALSFFKEAGPKTADQTKDWNAIRQLQALALSRSRYAEDLMSAAPDPRHRSKVEKHVKSAIESLYLLGQYLAQPELACVEVDSPEWRELVAPLVAPGTVPAPQPQSPGGGTENNPTTAHDGATSTSQESLARWCITDPANLERFQKDPVACEALSALWKADPQPLLTLHMQSEINRALQTGHIEIALDSNRNPVGYYFECPWSPVYQVVQPLTLNGKSLTPPQRFVFRVSASPIGPNRTFVREIKLGSFVPSHRRRAGAASKNSNPK